MTRLYLQDLKDAAERGKEVMGHVHATIQTAEDAIRDSGFNMAWDGVLVSETASVGWGKPYKKWGFTYKEGDNYKPLRDCPKDIRIIASLSMEFIVKGYTKLINNEVEKLKGLLNQ